jgi:PTH1 family peptidyl-tRNA hydrolase
MNKSGEIVHHFISQRNEGSGTITIGPLLSESRKRRRDTPPLGAEAEAKPPGSRACPGVTIPFIPKKFAVEDLVVICDNLDLPPGTIRIRKGGSSAGHNGLKSLIRHLGSADFVRIYVGIGRPEAPTTVIDHVLGVPQDRSESDALESGIRKAADAAIRLCNGQTVEEVSRVYNKRNGAG